MASAQEPERKLTPAFVYSQWQRTKERRDEQRIRMRRAKFAYESRLWAAEGRVTEGANSPEEGQIAVEVSRLPGIIQTYTGFLFPRSPRAAVSPDVEGSGDPEHAQMVINRWFSLRRIHKKLTNNIGQSLLYRGSALKLGLDFTKPRPQDRVWAKVIPWWDLVLDWDVQDVDEARFFGHEYWEDVAVLERRLGIEIPDDVVKDKRTPYFEETGSGRRRDASTGVSEDEDQQRQRRFVRVLEWYNLIDDFDTGSGKVRGRFEIYLVDRMTGDRDEEPLIAKPMPYSFPDGSPCVPIMPLLFDHEMEHPLRGIALSDRIYDQCKEIALLRSAQANAVRRDARVMFVDESAGIDESSLGDWVQGKDGAIVLVDKGKKSWDQVFFVPKFGSLSTNYAEYEAAIERDLNHGAQSPKFSRGEAMGARTTATEVRQLNQYMENRFGELARTKDAWIADIARVLLRLMLTAVKGPALQYNVEYGLEPGDPKAKQPEELIYRTGTERKVTTKVTAKDIDAEFDIGITDTASTPLTKELRKADLMQLSGGASLLDLWAQVEDGNPMAYQILSSVVELFELPSSFSPEALVSKQEDGMQKMMANPKVLMKALASLDDEFWTALLDDVEQARAQAAAQPPPGPGGPAGMPMPPEMATPMPPPVM